MPDTGADQGQHDFSNRTAIVTGSSRGIGAATAETLGARGASVTVNYHTSEDAAEEVAAAVSAAGGDAITVQADVRDPEAVNAMVETTEAELGPVDVLVNNANMSFATKPFVDLSWAEFSQKLTDELRAAYNCTQAVVPGMIEREYGRLVYVSSDAARNPRPGFSAHVTAKSGLNGLSRAVATELGQHGIVANVVAPDFARTDASAAYVEQFADEVAEATPLGRVADPEDIARSIAMFASEDAQFVTGSYTPANGGLMTE
jgi:3-oxoacyl-[acyl-carrier protein] reductase